MTMEASQSSVIGREAQVALLCTSSSLLINLGTRESSAKVGGAKLVTMLGGSSEFPLHCTMEGDKLKFPSLPSMVRGDETVP